MPRWLAARWSAFRASFLLEEVLEKTRPGSTIFAVLIIAAVVAAPALVPGLAAVADFRSPWLPLTLLSLGCCCSLAFAAIEGRGHLGAVLTASDQMFYVMTFEMSALLTAPPISYAYLVFMGLMLIVAQARAFSLTLVFGVTVCLPPLVAAVSLGDSVTSILTAAFCATAMLVSFNTGLRRQAPAARTQPPGWRRFLAAVRWLLDPGAQWKAHCESVSPEELASPRAVRRLFIAVPALLLCFIIPTFMVPVAALAQVRLPLLPLTAIVIAQAARIAQVFVGGQREVSAVLALLNMMLTAAAFAMASVLSAWPFDVVFAALFVSVLAVGPASHHGLTSLVVLALGLPAAAAAIMLPGDGADLLIGGGSLFVLWVSYNTGRQRKLRQRTESLQVALQASDRLASDSVEIALSRVLIGIGSFLHELRNAQTAVALGLEYLARPDVEEDEAREALADAMRGHNRAQNLVEKTIQDLRRRQPQRTSSFHLRSALEDAARGTDAHPPFELQGEPSGFHVSGDRDQLDIVITNLVRNAYQAGARRVTVRCKVSAAADAVTIEIADDGPGLPEAMIERPFSAFTTSRNFGGTGLGLYLSKRAIELMGGDISAANRPEGGAVFTLQLAGRLGPPAAAPSASAAAATAAD